MTGRTKRLLGTLAFAIGLLTVWGRAVNADEQDWLDRSVHPHAGVVLTASR